MSVKLVPELDVKDLDASLAYYMEVCGFRCVYQRPEERFAYLELDGAELMLQDAGGPGRRFRTAPLERPYGRGVNFQVKVRDVKALHERVCRAGHAVVIPLEARWYRSGDSEVGNLQFVTADPDGYLFRFYQDLGRRSH